MDCERRKALVEKYITIVLNLLIAIFAGMGFILSCCFARRDGYSHWSTRPLYFTQQSNIWIGVTSLIFAIFLLRKNVTQKQWMVISVFKYVFTVAITVTGVIFCSILAPFADYNVWTFASVLTHVVVPVLSVVDFFINKSIVKFNKKFVWCSFIPLVYYLIFASVLGAFNVDFGRGEPYPYFFLNFHSEVGLFGFIAKWPPQIGSFYWFVFFGGYIFLLGFVYYKIHANLCKRRKKEFDCNN
ncbi:MAG: hypothetical protein E7352_00345 [Clostridiales bacterium]|nr:hypothetical protein [Clostridiales bacterium]